MRRGKSIDRNSSYDWVLSHVRIEKHVSHLASPGQRCHLAAPIFQIIIIVLSWRQRKTRHSGWVCCQTVSYLYALHAYKKFPFYVHRLTQVKLSEARSIMLRNLYQFYHKFDHRHKQVYRDLTVFSLCSRCSVKKKKNNYWLSSFKIPNTISVVFKTIAYTCCLHEVGREGGSSEYYFFVLAELIYNR